MNEPEDMRSRRRRRVRFGYWDRRKALNALTVVGLRARAYWNRTLRGSVVPTVATGTVRGYAKLFIVGCPRSGTTWITSMLQHHPLVIGTTESHVYGTILGPFLDDRRLRGDRGWRVGLTRYDLMADDEPRIGLHRYIDRRTLCDLIVAARTRTDLSESEGAEQVIEWILDHFFTTHGGTLRHVLVEKTPEHQFYGQRILRRFPEARIVEVVRDGRDVCISMQRLARSHWWAPEDRRTQMETWARYVASGLALRSNPEFAGRVLQIHYEAVKANPRREIARVLTFANLECTEALLTQLVTDGAGSRPSLGPSRRRAVGNWQTHFTAEDAALFQRVAGDLARQLDYR